MRITIDVTKRDITLARGDAIENCPITRALWRTLGLRAKSKVGQGLLVNVSDIRFIADDTWDETDLASLPSIAVDFLDAFDNGREVEPFSFVANFNKARAKSIGLTLPTV